MHIIDWMQHSRKKVLEIRWKNILDSVKNKSVVDWLMPDDVCVCCPLVQVCSYAFRSIMIIKCTLLSDLIYLCLSHGSWKCRHHYHNRHCCKWNAAIEQSLCWTLLPSATSQWLLSQSQFVLLILPFRSKIWIHWACWELWELIAQLHYAFAILMPSDIC